MSDYFSKRGKPFTKDISVDFLNGFKAYINEIVDMGWLNEKFGVSEWNSYYDQEQWHVEIGLVNRKMLQEIGHAAYPLKGEFEKETILDIIEFFFRYISIPKKDGFDGPKARYQYTIGVNQLFQNFKLLYKLIKGSVKELHSSGLDENILKDSFEIPDKETEKLINFALEKFYSRKPSEQKIGLEKIVDAYQRISSWEGKNKKESVDKILNKVANGNFHIKKLFEQDSKELWKIANEFMIRHTEIDKKTINDTDFIEYLFYSYYNNIRLILKKYNYTKKSTDIDESIPF